MLDKLHNNDIVIVSNEIKNVLLEEMTKKKVMLNLKFYTKKEFIDNYYGCYKKEAIYHLMNKYHYNYGVCIDYLNNIYFDYEPLKKIKEELELNKLLVINKYFKKSIKRIVVIGYNLDKYLKDEINKYANLYIDIDEGNYKPVVYEFTNQSDEVAFIATKIIELSSKVKLSDIYLVNVNDDYKLDIKRIFNLFKIPINLVNSKKIYGTNTANLFIKTLEDSKDLEMSLNTISDNEVKNKLIDIINEYSFIDKIDDTYIEILKNEIKKASISCDKLDNAVNIINLLDIVDSDKYYFLMGFNQGVIPSVFHDDKLIKDKDRELLGLNTSLEELIIEKDNITKKIFSIPNLMISYREKNSYTTFYPSPLINDLELEVIENPNISLNLSNDYNKIELGIELDRYIKYNEIGDNLKVLINTYKDIPYSTYDNTFVKVSFDDLKEYLNGKTNLSYSSMNNYFLCAFRFYIQNILKLDPFVDSFAIFIGNLFHDCLSKMYTDDFDLRSCYDEYLKTRELTNKEKFFCEKLYSTLEFIIDTIHYQERFTKFNEVLTEQHINIDKSGKLEVNFLGFVDKIKYLEKEDGSWLVAIIDYKTGFVETTLDNINYGLHLQLPVYIYLTKKGLHKDVKIVGFYLQKILNSIPVDAVNLEEDLRKNLRLEGYTIDNEEDILAFDSSYDKSEVIKGMSLTSKGFSHYTKLVSDEDVNKIVNIVDEKIDEVCNAIYDADFKINPKRIDEKLIGCDFCKYKEVCYRREENIVDLVNTKKDDILNS